MQKFKNYHINLESNSKYKSKFKQKVKIIYAFEL